MSNTITFTHIPLTHSSGGSDSRRTILTEAELCSRLMALRLRASASAPQPARKTQ